MKPKTKIIILLSILLIFIIILISFLIIIYINNINNNLPKMTRIFYSGEGCNTCNYVTNMDTGVKTKVCTLKLCYYESYDK
jgi:hypothetical protein